MGLISKLKEKDFDNLDKSWNQKLSESLNVKFRTKPYIKPCT